MAADTPFDLTRLRIPLTASELPAASPAAPSTLSPATWTSTRRRPRRPRPQSPLPRHRPGERFLQGPIPMTWLGTAMRLPGKALHVAVAIWQQAGMKRSGTVKVNLSRVDGVTHSAASRGLDALERAGLVMVVRQKGRSPEITLCDVPGTACPERGISSDNPTEEIQQMDKINTNAPGRVGAAVVAERDDAIEKEAGDALGS